MPSIPALPSPPELEAEVLRFWKEERIFVKSLEATRGKPTFVFYEGPPTANGMPHNGHVLTRVMKDIVPRYRTMRGYHVPRRAGWDTHGLPVEVEVEKHLGIHGRDAIEAYGLEPFARTCIQSVFRYTREWEDLTDRIGFWLDTTDAYVTYHRDYIESVWWALAELFRKGLLYRDYKIVWWWPQGGTALSAGEMGEGYRTVDDPSVTVKFPVEGQSGTFLLAWTTTPWTLPSNVALAINPEADYAFVRVGDETLIAAEAVKPEGEVLRVVRGSALVGMRYEPLFRFAEPDAGRCFVVVAGAHVEIAQTGIVHTAPAFGEDDFQLRKVEGLGFLQLVGPDGKFVAGTGFCEGRFCKDCDKDLTRDLERRGLVFRNERIRHEYPFCPRADQDPLIQYARPGWFIRTTARKDEALANNAATSWLPETIRDGRFGDFLRNNVDWALSRERFWGTPLNIWTCEVCNVQVAPASVAEIEARGGVLAEGVDRDLQVHKPWIDRVKLRCDCGGSMHRASEVIDCWFDSGCVPFAQFGFPHKGREQFAAAFPADFISEAVDQTRGWFYSQMMTSTLLFDDATCDRYGLRKGFPRPFRHCTVLGHVCDADGKKESKSKGNYTSPDLVLKGTMTARVAPDSTLKPGQVGLKPPQVKSLGLGPAERLTAQDGTSLEVVARPVEGKDTVALHPDDAARIGDTAVLTPPFAPPGADAFRWLFCAANPPWSNTRISLKAILEGQREFLFRLRNCHQFLVLNQGDHEAELPGGVHVLDRWVLGELDALIVEVTDGLDAFRVYEPARAINAFVDGLSNWWLRRSRERFGTDAEAFHTLHHVLLTLSRLIAPFVPFTAEAIWRSMRVDGPESVHLCEWPVATGRRDAELARRMALVRELASLGLSARAEVGTRVRQPLSAAEVVLASPVDLGELVSLLQDELNVREVRFSRNARDFVSFKVKANFKTLGARLGADMKAVAAEIAREGAAVLDRLPNGLKVLGHPIQGDDLVVEVEPLPGFRAARSAAAVVALHAELDEDLREEGLAREVMAKVQGIRKSLGLSYDDRVALHVQGGERTGRMLTRFGAQIARTVGAVLAENTGERGEIEVDGETLLVWVARTR